MDTTINWEQKAANALDAIANKLGIGIDHFWPILVRQQVVDGIINLSIIITGLILSVILTRLTIKLGKEKSELCFGYGLAAGIVSLLTFLLITSYGSEMITKITNPEYHALKEIMELMK